MFVMGVSTISPCSCLLPISSAAPSLNIATDLYDAVNSSTNRRFLFPLTKKCRQLRIFQVESKGDEPSEIFPGLWEDPADGSGSDYDEEDKESEENDLDFESDWEEETYTASTTRMPGNSTSNKYEDDSEGERWAASTNKTVHSSASNSYEEDLAREVEQLLGPEEKAILQHNSTYNLDKLSTAKWELLQTLALSGQIRFMDKLLEDGIDIDSVDKDGLTALHKAIIGKKEAVISHLLRKGASPHIRDRDGASPLHYAVQLGAMQTVKLLIKYNVDVNVADNEGWTPLHVAVQTRKRDIVKVLLVNNADKNRRNKDGMTPLDLCLCYGKDFKAYDLAKLVKIVPANRDL